MSHQEEKFAEEYVRNGHNITRAGLAAGYSESYAKRRCGLLLKRPHVAARIQELEKAMGMQVKLSPEEIVWNLRKVFTDAYRDRKYADANKALELLGKAIGMWTERTVSRVEYVNMTDDEIKAGITKMAELLGIEVDENSSEGGGSDGNNRLEQVAPGRIEGDVIIDHENVGEAGE